MMIVTSNTLFSNDKVNNSSFYINLQHKYNLNEYVSVYPSDFIDAIT